MKLKLVILLFIFSYSFTSYSQKKTFSCINESGDILFNFESNYINPYSDGLALFKTYTIDENGEKNWGVGFIDEYGKIVLPPVYDNKDISKYGFVDGVSWIKQKDETEYVLIDKNGNKISEKTYEKVGNFKDGLCAVFQNDKMGFININGKEIIPCEYYGDKEFHDGLAFVSKTGKDSEYGFINKNGDIAIPFIYEKYRDTRFNNGECLVKKDSISCIINKKGDVVFTYDVCDNIHNFSNELVLASVNSEDKKLYGFINRNNQWIIKPEFEYISNFNDGNAIIRINGKYGVINKKGEYIIKPEFDKIHTRAKLYICLKDNTKTYYNNKGENFTTENIQQIKFKQKNEYYPYRNNYNKWGYLKEDGSVHIPAQFDYAGTFSEGKAWIY